MVRGGRSNVNQELGLFTQGLLIPRIELTSIKGNEEE